MADRSRLATGTIASMRRGITLLLLSVAEAHSTTGRPHADKSVRATRSTSCSLRPLSGRMRREGDWLGPRRCCHGAGRMGHNIGHNRILKPMQQLGVLAVVVLLGGQALGQGTASGAPSQTPDAARNPRGPTTLPSMATLFRTTSPSWIQFSWRTAVGCTWKHATTTRT